VCAIAVGAPEAPRRPGGPVPDPSQWLVFVVASLVLLVTPGPAVLYVVTRSLDQGRRAGLASVAGIGIGTLVHVTAATLGLSAVLTSSAVAFGAVKWVGAAYLVWIGVRRMLTPDDAGPRTPLLRQGMATVFRQGILVNLLNPKTALFFLAFLPQFVNPAHPVAPQVLALGLTFTAFGVTSDAAFALLAGSVRRAWLGGRGRVVLRSQRYLVGAVFVALGVTAALTRRAG
jgi:threonine/homoserine/homoserine lactone efflux protein